MNRSIVLRATRKKFAKCQTTTITTTITIKYNKRTETTCVEMVNVPIRSQTTSRQEPMSTTKMKQIRQIDCVRRINTHKILWNKSTLRILKHIAYMQKKNTDVIWCQKHTTFTALKSSKIVPWVAWTTAVCACDTRSASTRDHVRCTWQTSCQRFALWVVRQSLENNRPTTISKHKHAHK